MTACFATKGHRSEVRYLKERVSVRVRGQNLRSTFQGEHFCSSTLLLINDFPKCRSVDYLVFYITLELDSKIL